MPKVMLFTLLLITGPVLASSRMVKNPEKAATLNQAILKAPVLFPEEKNRGYWDRGCEDWPTEISPGAASFVRKNPELRIEKSNGFFRVFARIRITAERGESREALMKSVEALLSSGLRYKEWVMPGINEKPDGGSYFVSLESLNVRELSPHERYILSGPYKFKLLMFERSGYSSLEFRRDSDKAPDCEVFKKAKEKLTRFVYRMTPRKDLVELMLGEFWLFESEKNSVELRLRLAVKPSGIVYELMPEALMKREIETRGRRIFENFIAFRKSVLSANSATPIRAPSEKAGENPRSAR